MVRVNDEIGAVLQEYADLLAITGGDAFRVRTYEKAARSVGGCAVALLSPVGITTSTPASFSAATAYRPLLIALTWLAAATAAAAVVFWRNLRTAGRVIAGRPPQP